MANTKNDMLLQSAYIDILSDNYTLNGLLTISRTVMFKLATVKSSNFVACHSVDWRHRECSWTLEFVDFKLYAILLKWPTILLGS